MKNRFTVGIIALVLMIAPTAVFADDATDSEVVEVAIEEITEEAVTAESVETPESVEPSESVETPKSTEPEEVSEEQVPEEPKAEPEVEEKAESVSKESVVKDTATEKKVENTKKQKPNVMQTAADRVRTGNSDISDLRIPESKEDELFNALHEYGAFTVDVSEIAFDIDGGYIIGIYIIYDEDGVCDDEEDEDDTEEVESEESVTVESEEVPEVEAETEEVMENAVYEPPTFEDFNVSLPTEKGIWEKFIDFLKGIFKL